MRTPNYIYFYSLIFIFTLSACKQHLGADKYNEYLCNPKNGLVKDFTQGNLHIVCSYKPKESLFTGVDIRNAGKNTYCILKLSINDQQIENSFLHNELLYSKCLNYLNNSLYTDVLLCTSHDTIPASASLYARQYAATNASSVLVVFSSEKTTLNNGFDIIYQANKFGAGPIRFSFTADAINRTPALDH